MALTISSPAFDTGAAIPRQFTCEGDDVSPPLVFGSPPPGTKSFALIVDDPDAPDPAAPKTTWVHWVLYDIAEATEELPLDATRVGLPPGTREGTNDWRTTGYGGPCPPIGRHRYFFKLHALDTMLGELHRPTKATLLRAMEGHVLAKAEMIGTYEKTPRRR